MKKIQVCGALLSWSCSLAFCQSAAHTISFEIASIKPVAAGSPSSLWTGDSCREEPGRFNCPSVTVRTLIERAYNLKPYQLVSLSPVIDQGKYEVRATVPPKNTPEETKLMLRNLLAERFGLVAHMETRDLPIFELIIAKGGPKLQEPEKAPSTEAAATAQPSSSDRRQTAMLDREGLPVLPPGVPGMRAFPIMPNLRVSARMQSVGALIRMLDKEIGRPVVDKTGLTSVYDFNFLYRPARLAINSRTTAETEPFGQSVSPAEAASEPIPDLRAAFEHQLGLRLLPSKGPVEVLIVDKVRETPVEN